MAFGQVGPGERNIFYGHFLPSTDMRITCFIFKLLGFSLTDEV